MYAFGKADLHIHTTYSDGTATPSDLLAYIAAQLDLRVIAVTDHDTIAGALEARRLAPRYGLEVIVGEEVSTAEGHLLALFIEEELPPGKPAAETIAAVHAQGGICVAAHPYDWAVPSLGYAGLHNRCTGVRSGEWPLDAIEAINASLTWPRGGANRRASRIAGSLGLPTLGGSDSHSLATVGRGYTLFPGNSAADLYQAIRAGEVRCGGGIWSVSEYLEIGWLYVRQRSLLGALSLVFSSGAIPLHQAPLPSQGRHES